MPHAPSDAISRRHHAIRQAAASHSLDALVITALPNIAYLTNFSGSAAIVVLTGDRLHFITDFRYVTAFTADQRAAWACPGAELVTVASSYDTTLVEVLQSLPGGHVGFEAGHLTVARHDWLEGMLGEGHSSPKLVPTEGIVERARLRKDDYELATLRTAAEMLSGVVPQIVGEVRRGLSETEIALAIDTRIRRAGFEKTAFDTIVASGPQGALPHAHPGKRRIGEGD